MIYVVVVFLAVPKYAAEKLNKQEEDGDLKNTGRVTQQ